MRAKPPRKTCRRRISSAWPRSSALRGSSTTPRSPRAPPSRRTRSKPYKRALHTSKLLRQRPPTGLIPWPAIHLLWSKPPSRLRRFRDPPHRRPYRSTPFPLHPRAHRARRGLCRQHLRQSRASVLWLLRGTRSPPLPPRRSCQPLSGPPCLHGPRKGTGPRFLLRPSFPPSRGRARCRPPRGPGSCEGSVCLENRSG